MSQIVSQKRRRAYLKKILGYIRHSDSADNISLDVLVSMNPDGSKGQIAAFDMLTEELFKVRQSQEIILEEMRLNARQKASGLVNSKLFGWNFSVTLNSDEDAMTSYPDTLHGAVVITNDKDDHVHFCIYEDVKSGKHDSLIKDLGHDPDVCKDYNETDWSPSKEQQEIYRQVMSSICEHMARRLLVKIHSQDENTLVMEAEPVCGFTFDRWVDIYQEIMQALGLKMHADVRVDFTPVETRAVSVGLHCSRAKNDPENKSLQNDATDVVNKTYDDVGCSRFKKIRSYLKNHPYFGLDIDKWLQ